MITTPELFPDERRHDPKRRAEATVFDTLAECQRAGHALYEWGASDRPHRTDFRSLAGKHRPLRHRSQGRRIHPAPRERPVVPPQPRREPASQVQPPPAG